MPDAPDALAPKQHRATRLRAGALIGVLLGLLGFAIAVQVHANSRSDSLDSLREDDLIAILDDQNARSDRLRQQIADLQDSLQRLTASGDTSRAALQQAEREQATLGILLGTVPAAGPGVQVVITDPKHALGAEDLLDVVQELRGAGAEAISFGGVRVSTSTAFTGTAGALSVDGTALSAPYTVLAIGEAKTLQTALNIPGGVAAVVRAAGGALSTSEEQLLRITAVRSIPPMPHASPAG